MPDTALRAVLALFVAVAGVGHFTDADAFVAMVPSWLPSPRALVWISGVAELAGAVGILVPATRRAAGLGLIALFVAVFPANVNMALHDIPFGATHLPLWARWARLPLQAVLIAWAWRVAARRPPTPRPT
jgi:uncharacterized membrane protein